MSEPQKSFIDLSLEGKVSLDDIDDYVDAWHKEPGVESLGRFLGMKNAEYSLWVRDPDTLPYIIKARRENRSLVDLINDEYQHQRSPDGGKRQEAGAIGWCKSNPGKA